MGLTVGTCPIMEPVGSVMLTCCLAPDHAGAHLEAQIGDHGMFWALVEEVTVGGI